MIFMMNHSHIMNPPHPTVSVIIPTFNRAWCVAKAIESVLNQDYPGNVELIVVDDGSTDRTQPLLQSFGDRISVLQQPNKGVSSARNMGIKKSFGAFIALLDSDDLWLPEKLSCQIDFFQTHPEAMICQTEEIWIRNGKRVNPKRKHKKPSGMIFEPSLHLCLVSPSAVMMRRSFFDIKGLFDESLPACEDYDLWLRTAVDMPIYLIDTPCIIKQGGHDDQLSSHHSLDRYRIQSIAGLLEDDKKGKVQLKRSQRTAALSMLHAKCRIYAQGCEKRGKQDEVDFCRKIQGLHPLPNSRSNSVEKNA